MWLIKMKGITEDFLLFIAGIFVILIILATVFGKGIAYNVIGFLADLEPSYLQENIRTILIQAAYSPGDYESKVKVDLKHTILLYDVPYPMIGVDSTSPFNFSQPQPIPFLSNGCQIVKTCTKNCSLIGDTCATHDDCCGNKLSCIAGYCTDSLKLCGNGILDDGEECDSGNETANIQPNDADCRGLCNGNCMCSSMHTLCSNRIDDDFDGLIDIADSDCHTDHNAGNAASYDSTINSEYAGVNVAPQCNDSIDNNNNGLNNITDTYCHTDHNATNANSYDPSRFEIGWVGDTCTQNSNCYRLLKCMSKVKFDKIGGTLIIKKYFESGKCKIKIEKEGP
jgi:hypothetical protein